MKWIRFLSRVAFICNIFFLLSVALQWNSFIRDPAAISTIAIIGYFLAVFVFNPLANFIYLVLLIRRKRIRDFVAPWLAWCNFILFLLQMTFIFYLNDLLHS